MEADASNHRFSFFISNAEDLAGGKSAAVPVVSGIIALLNDARLRAGKPTMGFLNPFLYSSAGAAALNDVTTGDNPGCNTNGFPAKAGWDPVSFIRGCSEL